MELKNLMMTAKLQGASQSVLKWTRATYTEKLIIKGEVRQEASEETAEVLFHMSNSIF